MKKVRATATGFYKGARIYAGQAFAVPDHFNGSWFEVEGVDKENLGRRGRRRKMETPEAPETVEAEIISEEEASEKA